MPLVTIVNPSPRKGAKKMATRKKARTAKQKAATRRLVAMNRSRSKAARRPAAAPKRRSAKRRASPVAAAPKRRVSKSRRRAWKISSPRAASRAGRTLRYRRPNPIGFLSNTLMPAAVGGAGALAIDVAMGVLPLPATLKTGPFAPLVKVAGAVGLGMLAGKMVNRRVGEQLAVGALTVQFYNFAKAQLVKFGGGKIPGLSMYPDGYMGEYVSGQQGMIGYVDSGMQVGEYVSDDSMAGYESGVYR
jgi:hypothetical protein